MTATAPLEGTGRLHTIGAVCRALQAEFPDISISKIRYLEDQGLLTPKRTQGGYRMFAEEDVERLRTILTLQRDQFLPLRVIREELSSVGAQERLRRRRPGLTAEEEELTLDELCARAGIAPELARELEEYGLLLPHANGGDKRYFESDVDVAAVAARLAAFGLRPRNLRALRTAADREAALIDQLVAPALRSRNPERHQGALDDLTTLGALVQELGQLLFWRALRSVAAR